MPFIRPLAICVFRHHDRILVAVGHDPIKERAFYRPLGGSIEFGEHSRETVARELREEIGAEVAGLRYLGTLENLFMFEGKQGHEIVQVYDGAFVDTGLYHVESIEGHEDDESIGPFRAVWRSLPEIAAGDIPLYPDGLLELLYEG